MTGLINTCSFAAVGLNLYCMDGMDEYGWYGYIYMVHVASSIRSRRMELSLYLPSTPLTLLILFSSSVYRFLTSLAAKFALEELFHVIKK